MTPLKAGTHRRMIIPQKIIIGLHEFNECFSLAKN